MRYGRIIAEVLNIPWAIADAKFNAIATVLARCEAGERLSEEEIRERVGARKNRQLPYMANESGKFHSAFYDAEMSAAMKASGGSPQKLTAVIPVFGILVNRVASLDISETGTGVDALAQQFRSAMANPDVRTIVLLFDSPGGSVYGIDEFAQEIFDARGKGKKIIAQIDPLAASAAYYLAVSTDEIVMTPSGEAGSIGVRAMHQDLSKALEAEGIKVTNISAGKYKTEANPFEPLSEEGLAFMQQRVNDYYDLFVKAVARGRGVKASEVKNGFGEGRVVGAAEAKRLGMVDRIATFDETLARLGASSRAGMSADSGKAATAAQAAEKTATAEKMEVVNVENNNGQAAAAVDSSMEAIRAKGIAEANRIDRITQLAKMHNSTDKLASWLQSGVSVESVQTEILSTLRPQAIRQPAAEDNRVRVVTDEADKLEPGARIGRYMRAVAGAHRMKITPQQFAMKVLNDKVTADYFAAANPQDASSFAGGGFLINDNVSAEVIPLLRPKAVVRSLNPTLAPLVGGVLSLPKITGGAVATYIGENKPVIPTKITGGQVKATAKKLAALVPISNDLLRFSSSSADNLVRDDTVRAIAQIEDVSFIRGAGTAYTPKGIRNWALAANIIHANQTVNLANTRADIGKVRRALRGANVGFEKPGWIMSARTEEYLLNLADGNGNLVYYNEMVDKGTFRRYPYRVTTQVPENLSLLGGSNETELYFADFADIVICDAPVISVEVSGEAAYDDGTGTLISSFSNDQTVIRMIVEHDLIVRHQESIAVLDEVIWI